MTLATSIIVALHVFAIESVVFTWSVLPRDKECVKIASFSVLSDMVHGIIVNIFSNTSGIGGVSISQNRRAYSVGEHSLLRDTLAWVLDALGLYIKMWKTSNERTPNGHILRVQRELELLFCDAESILLRSERVKNK